MVSTRYSRHILLFFIISFLMSTFSSSSSSSSYHYGAPAKVPGLDQSVYMAWGDINVGAFLQTTASNGPVSCSDKVYSGSFVMETTEAVAFGIKLVNENPHLLPNVTLGFVEVNDCGNSNVALAHALSYLQRVRDSAPCACNDSNAMYSESQGYQCTASEMPFYDVIAVLAPFASQASSVVSRLYSSVQIPLVGCMSTSDEMSDKQRHPYYLRVLAPDKFQVRAMLSFIQANGWSYISVLYAQGVYGENAFDNIKQFSPEYGICVATSHRVNSLTNFDNVMNNLLAYPRARVVILYTYHNSVQDLFEASRTLNATGHFIWLGSNAWSSSVRATFERYHDGVLGAFTVSYLANIVPELYEYIRTIQVNASTNPWFRDVWEDIAGCSIEVDTECDTEQDIFSTDKFVFVQQTSLLLDGILAIAHAAHNLMADHCPGAVGYGARNCIQGDVLLRYLKNLSFQGFNGRVEFNENGDLEGSYKISQIVYGYKNVTSFKLNSTFGLEARTVAIYDTTNNVTNFTGRKINWDHLVQEERIVPLPTGSPQSSVPESVCSAPCKPGEFRIQQELTCCWVCRMCRDNEKLVKENTSCEACSLLTWPDPKTNYTTCINIPVTYPELSEAIPLLQICLGLAAFVSACLVVMAYVYFRETRIIKAASRELSVLQIAAIFVGYVTVIIFQTQPTDQTCGALYFLFCLSFAWLYSPLLVKTVRIYRIFQSGVKNSRPRFVNPQSQLIMTLCLILIQVLLCVFTYIVATPSAKTSQPVRTEKYAELSCDMTLLGLASFLTYNLLLVSLCSIFAFKTRKLPDNFNESKFISMCVSTTLVIWLAFVPTYFTATHKSVKGMLLSLALLLNHTVALIFLFVPKIYAAVYLDPEDIVGTRFHTTLNTAPTPRTGLSSRVSPIT